MSRRWGPILVGVLIACGDNGKGLRDSGAGDADPSVADALVDAPPDAPPDAPADGGVDALPYCGDGHVDPGEECDQWIVGLAEDGCSSTCTIESVTWTNLRPSPIPPRQDHVMAYDAVSEHCAPS